MSWKLCLFDDSWQGKLQELHRGKFFFHFSYVVSEGVLEKTSQVSPKESCVGRFARKPGRSGIQYSFRNLLRWLSRYVCKQPPGDFVYLLLRPSSFRGYNGEWIIIFQFLFLSQESIS